MFGGPMFRELEGDPIFGDAGGHFRQMEDPYGRMMSDLFGGGVRVAPAIDNGSYERDYGRRGERHHSRADHTPRPGPGALMPAGFGLPMFGGGMFDHMNAMMSNMQNMMNRAMASFNQQQMAPPRLSVSPQPPGFMPAVQPSFALMPNVQPTNDPNSHFYSSSTVMSYSNTGDGAPKVYQSSSSTSQVPGGVRETRKMMRNSTTGEEKMSVGRHIGERGHVIERRRNRQTGDSEENVDLVNLDEEEAPQFDQEWRQRTNTRGPRAVADSRHRNRVESMEQYVPSPLEQSAPRHPIPKELATGRHLARQRETKKVRLDSQSKKIH